MIKRLREFLNKCIEARDYLMGIYMFRCIYDVVRISWLFLCLLVTGYAMIVGISELIDGKTGMGPVLAIMVMFTCSGFLLKSILISPKDSTL